MGIDNDILQGICDLASRQVQELYPNLQTMFILHDRGMLSEIIDTSEHRIFQHKAGRIAATILEKNRAQDASSFMGIAIYHEARWLGLSSKDHTLALFNINREQFSDAEKARRAIYHLTWHAIDLMEVRQRPEYARKFRSGPLIPKRSPMNLARLNLQADTFAAVMSGLYGEEDAIASLAKDRAHGSLGSLQGQHAEDYPFCVAYESASYAYDELKSIKPAERTFARYARQLTLEVGSNIPDKSIRRWWGFSEPAQDMAWRGQEKDFILGCALYTSTDPYIRATGHLVADITGIEPVNGLELGSAYNAFVSKEQNKSLHREMVEKTFEEAIARGVAEESGQPFLLAANEQNESLTEGRILGWCANALQASARAFESALSSGVSPAVAARLEFEGTRHNPEWEDLETIGKRIVDKKQEGFAVTLGNVAELAHETQALASVLNSVKNTMNDPAYIKKLEAANDLMLQGPVPTASGPSGPAPSAPAPKGPAPKAPVLQMAPAGPAPGLGGNNASNMARLRALAQRAKQQKDASDEKKDK